jgi:hypothetical protein
MIFAKYKIVDIFNSIFTGHLAISTFIQSKAAGSSRTVARDNSDGKTLFRRSG